MTKKISATPTDVASPWDDTSTVSAEEIMAVAESIAESTKPRSISNAEYDLEGLMTDFPTAKELERFVFDETGIVLNLKGRANKLKYQTAMDALNGVDIDSKFIGTDNPYLDRADMVPVEAFPTIPERDPTLPPLEELQNYFFSPFVPHQDPDARAMGKKCHCTFRKYNNGVISYEINGPWEQKPSGTKIDKYGRSQPEIIKWVGSCTGEQTVQREDGTLTNTGRRLRTMMQSMRINAGNIWDTFVDKDYGQFNATAIVDPWGTDIRN